MGCQASKAVETSEGNKPEAQPEASAAPVEDKPAAAEAEPAQTEAEPAQTEAEPAAAAAPAEEPSPEEALKLELLTTEGLQPVYEIITSKDKIMDVWNAADFNGNGGCSLAELDRLVEAKGWEVSKPSLMRAYKHTTLKDGDGDPWVEKKEFAAFLRNLFFYERLWSIFDELDDNDDRRIDLSEFKAGMAKLGSNMSDAQAEAEFGKIDQNGGGKILFKEFCDYIIALSGAPALVIE